MLWNDLFMDCALQERELKLKASLKQIKLKRQVVKKARKQRELPSVAVVGYTNAGTVHLVLFLKQNMLCIVISDFSFHLQKILRNKNGLLKHVLCYHWSQWCLFTQAQLLSWISANYHLYGLVLGAIWWCEKSGVGKYMYWGHKMDMYCVNWKLWYDVLGG